MKFWTAHIRAGAAPVLVREGFSWGALIFGPLWLAAHRAWIAAALVLAAFVLIVFLATDGIAAALLTALVVLLGLSGHDLRRWSLDRRGICSPRSSRRATNWRRWSGCWTRPAGPLQAGSFAARREAGRR